MSDNPTPPGNPPSSIGEGRGKRKRGRPRRPPTEPSPRGPGDPRKKRALSLLDRLARAMKKSRRELDRLTGYGRGKTAQIFSGQTDLKLDHLLDFLHVLGVDPKDFFLALFAESEEELPAGPLSNLLDAQLDRVEERLRQMKASAPSAAPEAANASAKQSAPNPAAPIPPPLPAPAQQPLSAAPPSSADLDRIVAERLEAALERALGALALKALRQP